MSRWNSAQTLGGLRKRRGLNVKNIDATPISTNFVFVLLLLTPWLTQAKSGVADGMGIMLASNGFRSIAMGRMRANFFVRVKINGRPAALVIETGAPATTLDRKNAGSYGVKEVKSPVRLNGPMGHSREHIGLGFVPSISLGNVVLRKETVAVVDLSAMNSGSPIYVGGVLGLDSIRKLGAIIDCGRSTLYVRPPGATDQSQTKLNNFLTSRGYTRVPMELGSANLPEVSCRINSVSCKLVVETAAFTTILPRRVARRAGLRLTDTGETGEGVGKMTASISAGIAREFSVGQFQSQNQKLAAEDADFGVLGIDYLRAHHAVIDCGGMSLFLR